MNAGGENAAGPLVIGDVTSGYSSSTGVNVDACAGGMDEGVNCVLIRGDVREYWDYRAENGQIIITNASGVGTQNISRPTAKAAP